MTIDVDSTIQAAQEAVRRHRDARYSGMTDTQPASETAPPPVNGEIAVIRRLVNALETLDGPARRRVLLWLFDRYQREMDGPDTQSGT